MADQSQVLTVAHRLFASGARLGAAQVLFNAAVQRQAAERRDLPQAPRVGRRVDPAEHLHPANDEHPATPESPPPPVA